MSKESIKSDLAKVDAMSEKDLDYSEIAAFDEAFLRSVEMKLSPGKRKAKRSAAKFSSAGGNPPR